MKSSIVKLFAMALLTCLSMTDALAQINVGLLLNVGGSNISNYDDGSMKFPAFGIGGFATAGLSDNIALEGQLSFQTRGNSYDISMSAIPPFQPAVTYEGNVNLSYIQLAAIAKYVTETVSFGVGPALGILTSAQDKGDATVAGITSEYDDDFKDDAESIAIAAQLEVLYMINEALGLGLMGQFGLTSIFDASPGEDDPKNTFVGIKATYRLTNN